MIQSNVRSHGYALRLPEWVAVYSYPDTVVPQLVPGHPSVVSGDHVLFGDLGEIFQLRGNGWSVIEPYNVLPTTAGERRGMALAGTRDFTVVGSPFQRNAAGVWG